MFDLSVMDWVYGKDLVLSVTLNKTKRGLIEMDGCSFCRVLFIDGLI